jgi:hypothetical protein
MQLLRLWGKSIFLNWPLRGSVNCRKDYWIKRRKRRRKRLSPVITYRLFS